jgi:hypothetical protein
MNLFLCGGGGFSCWILGPETHYTSRGQQQTLTHPDIISVAKEPLHKKRKKNKEQGKKKHVLLKTPFSL